MVYIHRNSSDEANKEYIYIYLYKKPAWNAATRKTRKEMVCDETRSESYLVAGFGISNTESLDPCTKVSVT